MSTQDVSAEVRAYAQEHGWRPYDDEDGEMDGWVNADGLHITMSGTTAATSIRTQDCDGSIVDRWDGSMLDAPTAVEWMARTDGHST